jgi:hypothetical protein
MQIIGALSTILATVEELRVGFDEMVTNVTPRRMRLQHFSRVKALRTEGRITIVSHEPSCIRIAKSLMIALVSCPLWKKPSLPRLRTRLTRANVRRIWRVSSHLSLHTHNSVARSKFISLRSSDLKRTNSLWFFY